MVEGGGAQTCNIVRCNDTIFFGDVAVEQIEELLLPGHELHRLLAVQPLADVFLVAEVVAFVAAQVELVERKKVGNTVLLHEL